MYSSAVGLINQKVEIKVLAINTPKNWIEINSLPADFRGKTRFEFSIADTRFKPLRAVINLFTSKSYLVERFYSEGYNAALIRILKVEEFDVVQLEHLYMCLYLDTIRKHSKAKVILRPQNVETQVWKRFMKNTINPVIKIYLRVAIRRLEEFEIQMANKVDGIIAISAADAGSFREYAPGMPIVNVPIGYDFNTGRKYDPLKQFDEFPSFYHLGSMDWAPNVQSIKWFIEEVLPFIVKKYPEFTFRIAGKKMPLWIYKRQNNNLVVDGEVKDSMEYHERNSIMIVPLLSGGGLRAKIIEGMALGKTIISTTIGAEGIPYVDGQNILIANTREDFARQIKKCQDSWEFCQKIGRNAQLLARENFDNINAASSMLQFYDRVKES